MLKSTKEAISIFINLLKTIMGCGILKYPFLFKEYGIVPCVLLTIISALCSFSGIILYIDLNERYGLGNTLSTVSLHFSSHFKIMADIVVIFKCYTVALAYLIYLKEQLVYVSKCFNLDINIYLLLFGAVCIIAPLILASKIDKLKYTSSMGLMAILLLLFTSLYRCIKSDKLSDVMYVSGKHTYLNNLCHFVFSFTCHQNIFTIQNEMKFYDKTRLKWSAFLSFFAATTIYLIFGILSYLAFGDNIKNSFIDSHPQDNIKITLSVFYIFLLGLSLPLQTYPCKQYFLNMIDEKYFTCKKYRHVRVIFSLLMLLSLYGLACTNINFDSMCKIIGGTFSTCMCFIFASLFYFLSYRYKGSGFMNFLGVTSGVYGVLAMISIGLN